MTRTVFLLFFLFTIGAQLSAAQKCRVTQVVDGDTVRVIPKGETKEVRIRFWGIDAPEARQDYGAESSQHLHDLLNGREISYEYRDVDRYGRILATVYADSADICLQMIEDGAAWPYKDESPAPYYKAMQRAQKAHKGLWQKEGAIAPWVYRKQPRPLK